MMTRQIRTILLALAAGAAGLFVSDRIEFSKNTGFVTSAEAVIGRPATPLSYAGVARRTTRRAVAVGAAAAAPVVVAPAPVVVAPPPAVVVRPGCVQVVDVYGRLYWRCP